MISDSDNGLKNKAIKGMFWSTIGSFAFQFIRVITQIILARLLYPEAFGILAVVLSLITIVNYLIDNGLSLYIIRDKEVDDDKIYTIFIANLMFALIAYLILFFSSSIISTYFNEESLEFVLKWSSLVVIFNSISSVHKSLLIRDLNFKGISFISFISAIISGLIGIILAFLKFGLWTLVVYHLVFQIIQTSFLLIKYNHLKISKFKFNFFKESFSFSWKLMISGLLNTTYENIFNFVIGGLYSITTLGYFSNALKIRDGITQILLDSIQKVSFSYLSKFQDQKDMLKNTTIIILKMSVLIISPLLIGLAAISDTLIRILFGNLWLGMIPIIQVLCISGLFIPLHRINLNTLTVLGRTDIYLKFELIKKIILGCIILLAVIYKIELLTLLKVLLLNSIFIVFINSFYSQKLINYGVMSQLKDFSFALIPASIMGVIVYITSLIRYLETSILLIFQILIGVITFLFISSLMYKVEIKKVLILLKVKQE